MAPSRKRSRDGGHLVPTVTAPRSYARGEVVRLCRFRDGRRVAYATVQGYDAARDVLSLLFGCGERSDVSGRWRCVTRDAARPTPPVDAWRVVAGYLSARRVSRAACVCRTLSDATAGCAGEWKARLYARWPYPNRERDAVVGLDWRAVYRARHGAEVALRAALRRGASRARSGAWVPRLCADPTCRAVLGDRRAALSHASSAHERAWRDVSPDDAAWLAAHLARCRARRSAAAAKLDDPASSPTVRGNARKTEAEMRDLARAARDILRRYRAGRPPEMP